MDWDNDGTYGNGSPAGAGIDLTFTVYNRLFWGFPPQARG